MSDPVDNFFEIVDNIFHRSERLGQEFEQILELHLDELYESDDIMVSNDSTKIVPISPLTAKATKWPSFPPFIVSITNKMIVDHLRADSGYVTSQFTRAQLMSAVVEYLTSEECQPSELARLDGATTRRQIEDVINQYGWLNIKSLYSKEWVVDISTRSNGESWTYSFKAKTVVYEQGK